MTKLLRAVIKHANETGHVQGFRAVLRRASEVTATRSTVELERMLDGVIEAVASIALAKSERNQ